MNLDTCVNEVATLFCLLLLIIIRLGTDSNAAWNLSSSARLNNTWSQVALPLATVFRNDIVNRQWRLIITFSHLPLWWMASSSWHVLTMSYATQDAALKSIINYWSGFIKDFGRRCWLAGDCSPRIIAAAKTTKNITQFWDHLDWCHCWIYLPLFFIFSSLIFSAAP